MNNAILDAALEYAARGWSVIPISRDKKPLIPWKDATRDELTDPDNIKGWWKKYPSANVAIVTGKRSGGLVVIDLDVDDQKGVDGRYSLQEWCDENYIYDIESSATVATGRGGQHLYFRSDYDFHNQVGCLEGVDIRAEGGCVVAPPSVHGTTKREYTWDIESEDVTIPEADSDVVYFLTSMDTKPAASSSEKNDFDKITEQGGRNNQLFKFLSKLQGEGKEDEDIIEAAFFYNKTHLVPPLNNDEVSRTVQSVLSHTEWKGTAEEKKADKADKKSEQKERTFRKLKTADELMQKDIPDPEVFIGVGDELPFLVEGTCILSAKPKLGKSWLALAMCVAVAKGEDFLGYHTKQCSTLYLDLETSEALQQKRLRKILNGEKPPKKFYLDTETDSLERGFIDQIEDYLIQDPDIGIVVIDVFQIIRTASKNMKETEYEHAYRDITPLNELAQKHHIAIVLVCHDRKQVDFDDPFSNILGSTGLQGAATQMMVMFRKKKDDPIHISIKGKTIDGLPELDVQLDKAQWSIVSGVDYAEREKKELQEKYINSDIRRAVIEIANNNLIWKGSSGAVKNDAILYGIGLEDSTRDIGGFLHRYQGHFKNQDGVSVEIVKNGSGASYYKISKSTVDTVDEKRALTVDGFQNTDEMGIPEVPFS